MDREKQRPPSLPFPSLVSNTRLTRERVVYTVYQVFTGGRSKCISELLAAFMRLEVVYPTLTVCLETTSPFAAYRFRVPSVFRFFAKRLDVFITSLTVLGPRPVASTTWPIDCADGDRVRVLFSSKQFVSGKRSYKIIRDSSVCSRCTLARVSVIHAIEHVVRRIDLAYRNRRPATANKSYTKFWAARWQNHIPGQSNEWVGGERVIIFIDKSHRR